MADLDQFISSMKNLSIDLGEGLSDAVLSGAKVDMQPVTTICSIPARLACRIFCRESEEAEATVEAEG